MSWQLLALDLWLRAFEKRRLARETDVVAARARMERLAARFPPAPGERWSDRPLGGLPACRLAAPEGAATLLWFHGGAFCLGSARTHGRLVGALARRAGVGALLPEYRLAPEHPFPAALDDAEAAWTAAVAEGFAPGRVILGGDSAGGNLAFALLHRLLAVGGPVPAGVVAFSPWVDLTLAGASLRALAWRDAFLPARRIDEIRDLYLAGADPRDPGASPWLGRFEGAPPVLIQASAAEVLRDDAVRMAARLRADRVAVTLDLVPHVPHVWQVYHGTLPEADAALGRAAAFLRALGAAGQKPSR